MTKKYRVASKFRFTLFMTVLILCLVTVSGTLMGFNTASSSSRDLYNIVEIEAGDTIWDIATEYGPTSSDAHRIVQDICDINEITADELVAGQKIVVPVYQ